MRFGIFNCSDDLGLEKQSVCRILNYDNIEMLISTSLSANMENWLVLHVGDIIQNFKTQEESWKLEKQIMKPFI